MELRTEPITERQLEVARLITQGRSNPEIAEALGISLAGAKYHVSELLGRLNLERREQIADWYREHHNWRSRLRGLLALQSSPATRTRRVRCQAARTTEGRP